MGAELAYETGTAVSARALGRCLRGLTPGHDHLYERFASLGADGHADPHGLRSFVVGTGGRSLYTFAPPVAGSEVRDASSYGVIQLTLEADRYSWQFLPAAGSTFTDAGSDVCH